MTVVSALVNQLAAIPSMPIDPLISAGVTEAMERSRKVLSEAPTPKMNPWETEDMDQSEEEEEDDDDDLCDPSEELMPDRPLQEVQQTLFSSNLQNPFRIIESKEANESTFKPLRRVRTKLSYDPTVASDLPVEEGQQA